MEDSPHLDQYDEVVSRLQEEEAKVMGDLRKHQALLPQTTKKGTVNLESDKRVLNSFQDESDQSNFSFYLSQRRESQQSIESAMIQCSQFATYAKSKQIDLKERPPKALFSKISAKSVSSFFYSLIFLSSLPPQIPNPLSSIL